MAEGTSHPNRQISPSSVTHVVLLSTCLTGTILVSLVSYNRYLRQYKSTLDIPKSLLRKNWIYGKVTAVGDGDNFHFFHMPGGTIGGWGWLREIPILESNDIPQVTSSKNNMNHGNKSKNTKTKEFLSWTYSFLFRPKLTQKKISDHYLNLHVPYKGKRNLLTLSIRLCGIDAPERAHFGNPAQPFGDEALITLRHLILGRRIWIKPLSIDQYNRCVARVVYWSWLSGWKDVSLEMLKQGMAIVYEGKNNAEFDGKEKNIDYMSIYLGVKGKGYGVRRNS
ncbi:Lcl3p NDAI_0I01210 [Naumovozyma dairenensis CBS 421]|uniref:Probable endonuclease LCL3 n=1 Tax=Naumovozyma dairenensis (strain ATCC 10597 / BCRC 20456 / CBS 421 / NBRC 0211 / NRRL Y-12639) TaxID=1071378 RepID=G0WFX9_NAUDC|nr:hypothetical protein NDAI_0I01210 [Naumovozyma dairenensis CBS 421]CCD26690.1 hypothetical protein NDAI_0I01210 [Naumovozyma dairenensis CBS 421]